MIDKARIARAGFMENLAFELFSREGSTRSSGKVGMSIEYVNCVLLAWPVVTVTTNIEAKQKHKGPQVPERIKAVT